MASPKPLKQTIDLLSFRQNGQILHVSSISSPKNYPFASSGQRDDRKNQDRYEQANKRIRKKTPIGNKN